MDHSQWGPQVDALSDAYTTITYDLRGHGRTGGSARTAYTIDLFAEDLAALLDALAVERPVLCGHSMGGAVAQVYAARHPENVAGLVLADTFTPDLSTVTERIQLAALEATVVATRLLGFRRVQRLRAWLYERFSEGAAGDYGAYERLQLEAPPISTDEFAKIMRAMRAFPATEIDYAAIDAPTLVLYGEHEPAFLRRQAGKLAAAVPGALIREVPGAGHGSNLDEPAFFTAAVREVLERSAGEREG
jgi:pimeloyl-ACP methyl ester carboxylesterase